MKRKIVDTETGEITVTEDPVNITIGHVPPFFKTPWNHNTDDESARLRLTCKDPTLTQQHLAADQDINNILRKFMDTGELPNQSQPQYMHIPDNAGDLQDNIVTRWEVDTAWAALPKAAQAILRTPQAFCEYVEHCMATGDLDPLRELGLAKPKDSPQEPPEAPKAAPGGAPPPEPPKPAPAPAGAGK